MAGIPLRIGMPADCDQSPYQKSLLRCHQGSLGMIQAPALARANLPRPVFLKRASAPLRLISLSIPE